MYTPSPTPRELRLIRSRFAQRDSAKLEGATPMGEKLNGAFFWLGAFYLMYCARPQEVIPGLGWLPVAKVTGALAIVGLGLSVGRAPRRLSDLPREAYCLLGIVGVLFASAILSPVWRGGAFFTTLDFSKVCILWVLAFLLITSIERLRRIIAIQAASVAMISVIALVKGYSVDRLNAVIGGIYSNPNDLAFAIVLSLPLALALLLTTRALWERSLWLLGMLAMAVALIRTASRAGFIDLLIAGTVCLWYFGIKAGRFYLIPATAVVGAILLAVAGGTLTERFGATASDSVSKQEETATASYEERKVLIAKALDAITEYPLLGLGAGNFIVYSGLWLEVHAAYLQITVEGGVLALILYLMFFYRGFVNLRRVMRMHPDGDVGLLHGSLLASLIGFVVGAAFSPEAYHFFPYLTVCYSSVLLAIMQEQAPAKTASLPRARHRIRRSPVTTGGPELKTT